MSKRISSLLVVVLLLAAAFYIGTAVSNTSAQTTFVDFPVVTPEPVVLPESATQEEIILSDLYQRITLLVVSINVTARHPDTSSEFDFSDQLI